MPIYSSSVLENKILLSVLHGYKILSDVTEAPFKIKNFVPQRPWLCFPFPAQSYLSQKHISMVLFALSLHSILGSFQMESAIEM